MKVLLTGATGFLGRHTLPVLVARYGAQNVVGVSSKDYDLMQPAAVAAMFDAIKPDVVVHYAAYSGGIGANRAYPADFYFRNTILTALTFQEAAKRKVTKLVYPMGGCSYPATATSPIAETMLWRGFPQEESAGYSTAKMLGTVASKSYRTQYGLDSVVIIPGNMYGEYDNFSNLESHVVPAMIRRYYEAKLDGVKEIAMWGTGEPQRDFVYAGDVAATLPYFIESYSSAEPVNISRGSTTKIRQLAELVAKLLQFEGRIVWDTTKPDGQMVKIFSVGRLSSLGLSCPTEIEAGLKKTIEWFTANYAKHADGLRL